MSYVKTPVYNMQGDQLLTETTFEQVKQNTEPNAKTLNVVIEEITNDINVLKYSGDESGTPDPEVQNVIENVTVIETKIEAMEKDLAKTAYVDAQDAKVLSTAKGLINDKITISNVDLEDGVSALESGKLYVVYSE